MGVVMTVAGDVGIVGGTLTRGELVEVGASPERTGAELEGIDCEVVRTVGSAEGMAG